MAKLEEVLGKKLNSVKELRAEIKRLQDSLVGVDAESEQFKTTQQQLTVAQEEYVKVTRTATADNLAAKDSIVGMQREYKNLYDQYKLLSEEQRNSDFGKGMAESLNTLSEKLNSTKKDVGNFKDNIGRYAGDVTQVFSTMGISLGKLQTPLKLVTGGVRTLSAALKSLAANPVGAAIMVIVVAFQAMQKVAERVKKAIRENEESQMRLKESMAVFQPVLNAVTNLWDKLGQVVVKVIGWFTKAYEKIADLSTKFTDFIGVTKGANERMMESIKLSKELAKAENELIKTKRAYKVENAKDTAEVERLREEASETENLTEKKKMLEEAKRIQGEIDARNVEIAKEEYRIMEEQSKLTPNSTAENEKLADALAKVAQAEADAAKNARQFNREINRVTKSTTSSTKAIDENKKKAQDLYKQLIEDNKTEIQKLEDKYKEEKKLLEKYHLDTTLLTRKYENDKLTIIQKTFDKQEQMRLNDIRYAQRDAERYAETLDPLSKIDFNIGYTEETINNLQNIADEALKLKKIWEDTQALVPDGINIDEWFRDLFKEGSNFENFRWPLDKIRELFKEAGQITGDDIIDIKSIEENIKILKNQLASLNDEKIGANLSYKLNEQLSEYYTKIVQIRENEDSTLKGYRETNNLIAQEDYKLLEKRRDLLKQELDDFKGSQELKLQIQEEYYATLEELDSRHQEYEELVQERNFEILEASFDAYQKVGSSIQTVISSYSALVQAQLNDGKITEKEAKKKIKTLKNLEKVQLAVNIAGIAASTASGIMDIWSAFGAETKLNAEKAPDPITLGVLNGKALTAAILKTTGLAATGAANIAAASMGTIATIKGLNSQLADMGTSSSVAAPTPQLIDSTPYTYARTLQTQEEEDEMNRPIYVTVTDIEDGLKNKVTVTNESSF